MATVITATATGTTDRKLQQFPLGPVHRGLFLAVIPAEAGSQQFPEFMDSRIRGNDVAFVGLGSQL